MDRVILADVLKNLLSGVEHIEAMSCNRTDGLARGYMPGYIQQDIVQTGRGKFTLSWEYTDPAQHKKFVEFLKTRCGVEYI